MKQLLFVNNNMKVGGVQKSLCNLLWALEGRYEITLLLFSPVGEYMEQLPPSVRLLTAEHLFSYLGMDHRQSKASKKDLLVRSFLAASCRLFGRDFIMPWILRREAPLPGDYDCAVAFLHNGTPRTFYGGVQEYVLNKVSAKKKIAFLHCDYRSFGTDYKKNHRLLALFDGIAPCSEGCKQAFLQVLPQLESRCSTVRNCHQIHEIRRLAEAACPPFDPHKCNVLMVSRLAREKGIERALAALEVCVRSVPIHLHIVGDGKMRPVLEAMVQEKNLRPFVTFYGEQGNPYPFMAAADLLLMSSYHEAAPMVIEEAQILGLPVLTTQTTSSRDMVLEPGLGWVCPNQQEALTRSLREISSDLSRLRQKKEQLRRQNRDNTVPVSQFIHLVEDFHG